MPTLPSLPTTPPPPVRFSEYRRARQRRHQLFTRLLAVVALVALMVSWRYRLVWVVGESMLPTYRTGDLLVVDKRAYQGSPPARGDIVVARHHDELVVEDPLDQVLLACAIFEDVQTVELLDRLSVSVVVGPSVPATTEFQFSVDASDSAGTES